MRTKKKHNRMKKPKKTRRRMYGGAKFTDINECNNHVDDLTEQNEINNELINENDVEILELKDKNEKLQTNLEKLKTELLKEKEENKTKLNNTSRFQERTLDEIEKLKNKINELNKGIVEKETNISKYEETKRADDVQIKELTEKLEESVESNLLLINDLNDEKNDLTTQLQNLNNEKNDLSKKLQNLLTFLPKTGNIVKFLPKTGNIRKEMIIPPPNTLRPTRKNRNVNRI